MTCHAISGGSAPLRTAEDSNVSLQICSLVYFILSPAPTSETLYSWVWISGQILESIHTLCIFYWYRATGEALKCLKLLLCLLARVWWMTRDRAFNEVFCQLAFIKHIRHFVCVCACVCSCVQVSEPQTQMLLRIHTHTHTNTHTHTHSLK